VWELVDSFSSAVGTTYRETQALLLRRDDRRRDALLDALLDGRGSERAVAADAAAGLDLPQHARYVVVVLDGTDTGQVAADALSVRGLRAAWRARADREIAIVALSAAGPAEVVRALEVVPAVRAGCRPLSSGLQRSTWRTAWPRRHGVPWRGRSTRWSSWTTGWPAPCS